MGLDPVHQRGFGPREDEVYGVLDGELDQCWEIANADIDVGDVRKAIGGAPVSCTVQLSPIQSHPARPAIAGAGAGVDPPGAT